MRNRLVRWIGGRGRPVSAEEAARRVREATSILLVKPHHKIGDLVVATPLIRALRRALPRARLVFVAGPYNAPAVLDNPDLDEVLVVPLRGLKGLAAGAMAAARLRRRRFDVALVLSTISQSTSAVLLTRLARPGLITGLDDVPFGGDLAAVAYDCVLPAPRDARVHIVDYHLALAEGLGLPVESREHVIGVTEEQRSAGRDVLRRAGLDPDRPILGIQPGGTPGHRRRHWSPAQYAGVAQRARIEANLQVALMGRAEDAEAIGAVQRLSRSPFPEVTDLSFPLYKGVLRSLGFFLTHDGGPAHIAAAVGVPCYLIYLATPAWRWAPYGAHVHVWDDLSTPPSALDVWQRVKPLLEQLAIRRETA